MNVFEYRSGLVEGVAPSFAKVGSRLVEAGDTDDVVLTDWRGEDHLRLPASEIHTIKVDRHRECSWFVIEGKEDPGYSGLSYHPTAPTIRPNLYRKPTAGDVMGILTRCDLL